MCAGQTQTTDVHVLLEDRVGRLSIDRQIDVTADRKAYATESDAPPGLYRLRVVSASSACAATRFVYLLPGADRHVTVAVTSRPDDWPRPTYILAGTIPSSVASSLRPTPALFDANVRCDEPAGTPMALRALTEYDRGSYSISLFAEPNVAQGSQSLTLDLQSPANVDHYVYVPMPFPIAVPRDGWPIVVRLDVPLALIETLDASTASWMVCPRLNVSSSR